MANTHSRDVAVKTFYVRDGNKSHPECVIRAGIANNQNNIRVTITTSDKNDKHIRIYYVLLSDISNN